MTDTREALYGEAIWATSRNDEGTISATGANIVARAVMALADAEQADLRAELEKYKRGAHELGRIIDQQGRMVLDATGLHDRVNEDGDGDWGGIWDNLLELLPRALKAEQECRDRECTEQDVRARLADAENTLTDLREQLRDAQVRLDEQRRMTDAAEAAAERRLDQSIMWTDRAERAENTLARVRLLADMWDEQYLFPASKVDFADAARRCAESLRAALDGTS